MIQDFYFVCFELCCVLLQSNLIKNSDRQSKLSPVFGLPSFNLSLKKYFV